MSAITSTNFELLKAKLPALAALGAFAESCARPDPTGAVANPRTFAEQVTELRHFMGGRILQAGNDNACQPQGATARTRTTSAGLLRLDTSDLGNPHEKAVVVANRREFDAVFAKAMR